MYTYSSPPRIPPTHPRHRLILLGLILLAGVVICIVTGVLSYRADQLTTLTPTATVTIPPAPTATPYRGIGDTSTLGGTLLGFDRQFGPPVQQGHYPATVVGVAVTIIVARDAATDHINDIDITPTGSWTLTQAIAVALTFLPADARHVRDFALAPPPHLIEHVYQSATLAATFPASAFTTAADAALAPGTLSYVCAATPTFADCNLGVGTD